MKFCFIMYLLNKHLGYLIKIDIVSGFHENLKKFLTRIFSSESCIFSFLHIPYLQEQYLFTVTMVVHVQTRLDRDIYRHKCNDSRISH